MLSIRLEIHRNILSAQCYIQYVGDSVNAIQVECYSSKLQVLLLMNDEIVKKCKINAPNDFFIPSSLFCDSDLSVKLGSTVLCRSTSAPAGQCVAKCNFRLQLSGIDQLDHSECELKVDVKDFFKERFKNGAHWNLCCSNCGTGLSLKPLFIERVQEYTESELSDGWFCHGNGPQPALQPLSQTLYLDDTSFYLYFAQDWDINHKVSAVLNKKYSSSHDNVCSDVSHSDSSGISCSSKSTVDCSNPANIDQSINQDHHSFDLSTTNFIRDKKLNHSTVLNLNCAGVKDQNDTDPQVLSNFVTPNSDDKHSAVHKNEYLNNYKVLKPVECQACGSILASEKPSFPFIRFYIDKLMFKNSSFDEHHFEYARKIALLSFWSLVTRSQSSLLPCKLFLQNQVPGEDLCVLLWIPSVPLARFQFQEHLDGIPLEVNLKTEPVYKVLYFVGTSQSKNVRSWRHDFAVDFYHVSDTMVKFLIKILKSSSSHHPEISDAEGFSCGFLRAPSLYLL